MTAVETFGIFFEEINAVNVINYWRSKFGPNVFWNTATDRFGSLMDKREKKYTFSVNLTEKVNMCEINRIFLLQIWPLFF